MNGNLSSLKSAEKLEKLEKELLKLKKEGGKQPAGVPISLKGTLKKTKVTEKDISAAKKSLFKGTR